MSDVTLSGSYAYVVDGWGLHIFDVSNPANPHEIGSLGTPGSAHGVAVAGSYAYVAEWFGELPRIIDVRISLRPTWLAFTHTSGNAGDVAVAGNYAYVADGDAAYASSMSRTRLHQVRSGFRDNGTRGLVELAEWELCLRRRWEWLQYHQCLGPGGFERTGLYDTQGYTGGVAVSGSYAYVAYGDSGLRIIDVSNPTTLARLSFYDTPGKVWKWWWLGTMLTSRIGRADCASSMSLTRQSLARPANTIRQADARGAALAGGYAFVAYGRYGLFIIDVSKSSVPSDRHVRYAGGDPVRGGSRGLCVRR